MAIEDNPKEDVMLDPTWSMLEDGNGARILAMGGKSFIEKDGRKVIKWRVKVNDFVRKRYNWKIGKELNNQWFGEFITAESDLIPTNIYDDANKIWTYTKDFNHQPTALSERESSLQAKISFLQNSNLLLTGQVIRLTEQLNDAQLSTGKFISAGMDVVERAGAVAANMNNKNRDEQK